MANYKSKATKQKDYIPLQDVYRVLNKQLYLDLEKIEKKLYNGGFKSYSKFLDKIEASVALTYSKLEDCLIKGLDSDHKDDLVSMIDEEEQKKEAKGLVKTLGLPEEVLDKPCIVRYLLDSKFNAIGTSDGRLTLTYMTNLIKEGYIVSSLKAEKMKTLLDY